MESVSFRRVFDSIGDAGAFSGSREDASAEIPFSETLEQSRSSEEPNPVTEEVKPVVARFSSGGTAEIWRIAPLPIEPAERMPRGLSLQKASTAAAAEEPLLHQGNLCVSGSPGAPETPSPSILSDGLWIRPSAVSKQQVLPEEPEAGFPVSEDSLQKVLETAAPESSMPDPCPLPFREEGGSRGRKRPFGAEEEEAAPLLRSLETDPELLALFPSQSPCPPAAVLSTRGECAVFSNPPAPLLPSRFPVGQAGTELSAVKNAPLPDPTGRPAACSPEEIRWTLPVRPDVSLPEKGLGETFDLGNGNERPVFPLDLLLKKRQLKGNEVGSKILTRAEFPAVLPASSKEAKKVVQESRGLASMLNGGDFPLTQKGQAVQGREAAVFTGSPALEAGIRQVTAYLSSAKGRQRGILRLHPPELGDVRVVLLSVGEKVRLHLNVESPDVREMLLKSEGNLREGLRQQGILLGEMTVDVNGQPRQGFGAPSSGKEEGVPSAAVAEEDFTESVPDAVEARLDLVNGLFSWVA